MHYYTFKQLTYTSEFHLSRTSVLISHLYSPRHSTKSPPKGFLPFSRSHVKLGLLNMPSNPLPTPNTESFRKAHVMLTKAPSLEKHLGIWRGGLEEIGESRVYFLGYPKVRRGFQPHNLGLHSIKAFCIIFLLPSFPSRSPSRYNWHLNPYAETRGDLFIMPYSPFSPPSALLVLWQPP